VKPKHWTILTTGGIILIAAFLYLRAPIIMGDWTKQTVYLSAINYIHCQIADASPKLLLIDDDAGDGIYEIKDICDELGMKATYAMIPMKTSRAICDTLVAWQREGFGIAIHGYKHHRWKEWSVDSILADISLCESYMKQRDFDMKKIRIVVPPYGCNTRNIREAIQRKGYQMVTGAHIINPDTSVFQIGRIFITKDTDPLEVKRLLLRAKEGRAFAVIGTHSSHPKEFSKEKTKTILKMAQDMGFQ